MLVPTNKGFLSMLWKNGLFIPILDKVKDALPATVLYNVMVGSISPDKAQLFNKTTQGAAPSAYGLLGGSGNANLGYYAEQAEGGNWFYYFQPGMNGGLAGAGTVIPVCNSYIYITDEVLVPSDDEKLGGVQAVTIPEGLFGGDSGSQEPATAGNTTAPVAPPAVEEPPAPSCVIPSNVKPVEPAPTPAVSAPAGSVLPVLLEPTPAPTSPAPAAPVAATCNTTLAEAANSNGLSILSTALAQPAIASQMPDPSNPTTYFAPVDSAFLNLLTTLNISITDALALGDKLAGVILYHIHPSESLSIDALAQRDTVNTELGFRMNDASQYTVGVESTTSALSLKGARTGNVATVQKQFPLCGSNVIVIDQVLLPAETLEQLPSPGPNVVANAAMGDPVVLAATTPSAGDPAPSTDATLGDTLGTLVDTVGNLTGGGSDGSNPLGGIPDLIDEIVPGILDGGIASGVGQFMNCTIKMKAAGTELTTTTDSNGRFAFPGVPECALADGTVTLPAGLDQLATCIDNSTGLQPPYTLSTLLSTFLGGGAGNMTSSGLATGDFPLNLSPLTSLLSSLGLGANGGNGTGINLGDIVGSVSGALGFNNQSNAAFGDFLQGLTDGNPDSLANILTNAQSMISSLVGSDVLSQLLPGTSVDQAVAALNQVVGTDPQKFLTNLTNPATIQELLQSGFNLLQGGFLGGNSGSGSTGGLTDLISGITGGRKMLQDPSATSTAAAPAPAPSSFPTQEELSAIFAAVAQPTALLNKLAKDAAASGDGSLTPQEIANLASRCARVAQLRLAPAAADLANGKLTLSDFQNSYTDDQVTKAVSMEDTSSLTIPQTTISPAPPASAAGSVYGGSVATMLAGLLSVTLYAGVF
jgi:uncharacterized surface protein with fasciclin (FAS1) repeats